MSIRPPFNWFRFILLSLVIWGTTTPFTLASEPVAVLRVASVNRLVSDADALSEKTSRPEIARFVKALMAIANNLDGLDTERCCCVEFLVPEVQGEQPTFRIALPLTSPDAFRATVQRLGLEFYEEGSSLRLRKRGEGEGKHPYVRFDDDKVLVSPTESAFEAPLMTPLEVVDGSDILLTFDATRIPRRLKEKLREKLHSDSEVDQRQRLGESDADHALRVEVLQFAERCVALFIEETTSIEVALDFIPEGDAVAPVAMVLSTRWKTLTAGTIAQQLQHLNSEENYFSASTTTPAALRVQALALVPPRVCDLLAQVANRAREAVKKELEKATRQQRDVVLGLFEAFDQSLESQHAEVLLEFVPTESDMALLAGVHIKGAERLNDAMQVLLPEAEKSDGIEHVNLNALTVNGIALHRVHSHDRNLIEQSLYGKDSTLYVGAGGNALWIAVGHDKLQDEVRERMTAVASENDWPARIGSIELHVRPWLPYLEKIGRDPQFVDALKTAFADEQRDAIHATVQVEPDGLSSQVTFDEPFLQLIATAITGRMKGRR
ncbi:MAG: hypothetical protein R3C18_14310 [Planctomycetaceae bacterium]